MKKTAVKTYKDPVMNKLIQSKSIWNKEVSAFINDLIHFKKMMNGSPSKFYTQRSSIVKPIPADPATIIGSLLGDFQEIVNKGNAIIQEQADFVATRNKRKGDQALDKLDKAHGPTEETPGIDLAKQLTASDMVSDYYLISEASNPLTRFFHRLLMPSFGLSDEAARIRKYRISLLNAIINIFKDCKKLQSSIVESNAQSIFITSKILDKIEDNYIFILSGLQSFKDALPEGIDDAGGDIKIPSSDKKEEAAKIEKSPSSELKETKEPNVLLAIEAIQDIMKYKGNFPRASGLSNLFSLSQKFSKSSSDEKSKLADNLISEYKRVLMQLSADKRIPPQNSLENIWKLVNPAAAQENLQTVAQNILGKWRHQISPFDKTSAFRLDVYNLGGESRKISDKIIEELQKDLDLDELEPLIKQLGGNLIKIRNLLRTLAATTKGIGNQPEFMSMLEKGRLGDHNVDLKSKQKEQLEKLLEQKQMRDLTKMYGR